MRTEDELSTEDLQRVNNFLNSGYNRVERKPARFWLLLGIVWLVILALGGVSYWIATASNIL